MTRNRSWIVIGALAVVALVALVIALAAGGNDSSTATAHETGHVTVAGAKLPTFTGTADDPAIGDVIPTLRGVSFDGSPVTIEPDGKPQIIVFLSHSCPHCQAEVPRIVSLAEDGKLRDVGVVGVATNTSPALPNYPPSAWLKREHWPYPVLADSKQFTALRAYGLPAFPYFVFVDAQGRVAARATGEIAPADLAAVAKALAAGQPLVSSSSGGSTAAG